MSYHNDYVQVQVVVANLSHIASLFRFIKLTLYMIINDFLLSLLLSQQRYALIYSLNFFFLNNISVYYAPVVILIL